MQSVVMHLRALLQTQPARCVCLPGAFNGFVGRLCAETGFKACYLSGGALSASCGIPDTGILERSRFVAAVKEISRASKLPILADADTGFGTHIDTYETVRLYHEAGASGFHIEDQVFPKRCGHLAGKELVPLEEFCNKIKAACRARDECTQGQFIICARTDARSVLGLDEALERGKAYAELGADMLFPEGLETEAEFRLFASEIRQHFKKIGKQSPYLLANMTEFGKTPFIPLTDFESLGYNCVIYPVSTFRVAMKSAKDLLQHLKKHGTVESQVPSMYSRQELYQTLGYHIHEEWNDFDSGSLFHSMK